MNLHELNELRDFCQIAKSQKCIDFFLRYPLGSEWKANQRIIEETIYSDSEAIDKVHTIHESNVFNVHNKNSELKKLEAQWWDEYLIREFAVDLKTYDPAYQDSVTNSEKGQIFHNGRRVSNDFYLKFAYVLNLARNIDIDKETKPIIMELGPGHGTLARMMKIRYPNCKYILVDLPVSLFFSYINLKLNFKDSGFKKVTDIEDFYSSLSDPGIDFIFIPTFLTEEIENGTQIDLFINTNSLGEQDNNSIEYWFKFFQTKLVVRYLFLANRFLNHFGPLFQKYRIHQNKGSLLLDKNWKIIEWKIESEHERCPYQGMIAPRILSIIAERISENNMSSNDEFYYEEWYRLYEGDPNVEPISLSRTHNPLYIDVTTRGTIFKLWNSIRLSPNEKNVDAMIKYLAIIKRKFPIEEQYFYFDLYFKITGKKHPLGKSWNLYRAMRFFFAYIEAKVHVKGILRKLHIIWLPKKLVSLPKVQCLLKKIGKT